MLKRLLIIESISILLIVIGVFLFFWDNWIHEQVGSIISFIGITSLIIAPVTFHVAKAKKTKVLAIYLLIFSIINLLRHFELFYLILDPKEFLEGLSYFGISSISITVRYSIWIILTVFVVNRSLKILRTTDTFESVISKKWFWIVIFVVFLLILLEAPIYNFHGDFAGYPHGHSFWNFYHIH